MNYKFHKLTPNRTMDLGIYEQAIEYAFAEKDIRNIAISGAYGAGKSSVIESYEEKHKEPVGEVPARKFLHISLAHFEDIERECAEENEDTQTDKMEVRLEGKILNQLIHQIEPEKIPLTDFKTKGEANTTKLWGYTCWITVFCGLLLFVVFNGKWCGFIKSLWGKNQVSQILRSRLLVFIAGIVLAFIAVKGIYTFLKLQTERKLLKKFIIQGNEFEILGDCKDSYFDRYLNEVMYLFEHVDADAIVFEDIDRFKSNQIFEKLREINTLLSKRGKELKFFYLLRDDIFKTTDRTKFFDFIIPIVPVIDGSNAFDMCLRCFEEARIKHLFSEGFLEGLALFIEDMRILKNILNEFTIYHGRFEQKQIGLDWDKLLAIITYKNLFPKDFSDLQVRRGYVYTLFASKDELRRKEIVKLEQKINIYRKKIEQVDEEFCETLDELDAIYFLTEKRLRVNGKEEEAFSNKAEFVKAIKEYPDKVSYYHVDYYGNGTWKAFDAKPIFARFQKQQEYQDRKSIVEQKIQNEKIKFQAEISRMEQQIEGVEAKSLQKLISRQNQNEIFAMTYTNPLGEEEAFEDVKRSSYFELIQYLIVKGYIDESYSDYMTYFYENSISAEDKKFLRAVVGGRPLPFHYQLQNPELVISKLQDYHFDEYEVLNFDLMDYMLNQPLQYARKLKRCIGQICCFEYDDFIQAYINRGKNSRMFAKEMNAASSEIVDYVLKSSVFEEAKLRYVIDTLCVSSEEDILANNFNDSLKQYIEEHIGFINIAEKDIPAVLQGMRLMEVKIGKVNLAMVTPDIFVHIYQGNMYQLNKDMVTAILECFYGYDFSEIDWNSNLTQIFSGDNQPLETYVKENLRDYIKVVLETAENIDDEEETAVYVLNNENVMATDKSIYMKKFRGVITSLEAVADTQLWPFLIENKVLGESIENLCDYYFKSGKKLDDKLVSYINEAEKPFVITEMDIDASYGDGAKAKLFADVIQCKELEETRYDKMLSSFNLVYGNFPYDNITDSMMKVLVRRFIVRMTADNLKMMRKSYPSCIKYFVSHNVHLYVSLLQDLNLFNEEEFMYLIDKYPTYKEETDQRIVELAVSHVALLVEERSEINQEFLKMILSHSDVDEGQRKIILARQAAYLSKSQMKEFLGSVGMTLVAGVFDGKRPSVDATDENKVLLKALTDQGMISSFTVDPQNEDKYKIYGKVKKRG